MFLVLVRGRFVTYLPQPLREQLERIVPKRIDLDRLTAARCHNPIAHLRVHPGEGIAFFALREQTVGWIDMNIELRATQMAFDDVDQRRQEQFESGAIVRRFQITVERMKEPKRRVGGVIFPFGGLVWEHVWDETVADVI